MSGKQQLRVADIGHVEHVTIAAAPRLPSPGEIAHLDDVVTIPGGGGGLAFFQLTRTPAEVHLFTALGNDDAAQLVSDRIDATNSRVHAAHRDQPQTRDLVLVTPDGERTIFVQGEPLHPVMADALPWDLLEGFDAVYFTGEDAELLRVEWNYRLIAAEHNLFYPQSSVTPDEVRKRITKDRSLFERIAAHEPIWEAYHSLALISDGRTSEAEFFSVRRPVPFVPLLEKFVRSNAYAPSLPSWYRVTARSWLKNLGRRSKTKPKFSVNPVEQRRDESASLSLYLMSNCLLDERFTWAAQRLTAIWRISRRRFGNAGDWRVWLLKQHDEALERVRPASSYRTDERKRARFDGIGKHLAEPLDQRNTLLDPSPYDLPLIDYRDHLKQLVVLAGGDPTKGVWEDWVEALLWDLRPRPIPSDRTELGGPEVLRDEWVVPAGVAAGRPIPSAPPVAPTVRFRETDWGQGTLLRIEIPSRWFSFRSVPGELRDDVLQAVYRIWGSHREMLSHAQRVGFLRGLVHSSEPTDRERGLKISGTNTKRNC